MLHNAHNKRVKENIKGDKLFSFNMDNETLINRNEQRRKKKFYRKIANDLNISVSDVLYLKHIRDPSFVLTEGMNFPEEYLVYPENAEIQEGCSMLKRIIEEVHILDDQLQKLNSLIQPQNDNSFEKGFTEQTDSVYQLNDSMEDVVEEISATDIWIRDLHNVPNNQMSFLDKSLEDFFSQLEKDPSHSV
jgi:hypothetical protein